MDLSDEIKADLVQFAKYSTSGDADAARIFGMRRVRELMKKDPALAHALRQALVDPQKVREDFGSPVTRKATPVWESKGPDDDGSFDFLRIDESPNLLVQPEYSNPVKAVLQSIVSEHQMPDRLQRMGLFPTKTVLFSGPPGVGKTMAAAWLARQMRKPMLVLDLGTVMSRYLGATGANLKRAFGYALQNDGVLFLDELDALAKRRDDTADVGELKRLVTVLLQQLDDWPAGRLLIAATNHPQLLDDAVWRRFETRVEFPRPGVEELKALMATITPAEINLPEVWTETLPKVFAGTSHSEFVQAFTQLRKITVLEPHVSSTDALARVVRDRLTVISRKDAKAIALTLAKSGTLSLRQISELTHVSRDTMRRAGIQGG
jgi:ATP-dependent 26S proteasome regulatory subunit